MKKSFECVCISGGDLGILIVGCSKVLTFEMKGRVIFNNNMLSYMNTVGDLA